MNGRQIIYDNLYEYLLENDDDCIHDSELYYHYHKSSKKSSSDNNTSTNNTSTNNTSNATDFTNTITSTISDLFDAYDKLFNSMYLYLDDDNELVIDIESTDEDIDKKYIQNVLNDPVINSLSDEERVRYVKTIAQIHKHEIDLNKEIEHKICNLKLTQLNILYDAFTRKLQEYYNDDYDEVTVEVDESENI